MKVYIVLSDYRAEKEVCSIHATEEDAKKEVNIINARFNNCGLENFAYYKVGDLKFNQPRIFDTDWIEYDK